MLYNEVGFFYCCRMIVFVVQFHLIDNMSAYELKAAKNEIQATTIHNGVQQKDIGFNIYMENIV